MTAPLRVLITGITGFAGGHLAEALQGGPPVELHGLCRRASFPPDWPTHAGPVTLHACDLSDQALLRNLMATIQPDQVYHLAGYAHVGRSLQEPDLAWAGNLVATRHLLDAVWQAKCRCRILYVSSGLIYGEPEAPGQALNERTPMRPATPYAVSKAAADLLSYQATRTPGLDIVRVRPFNHIGPRQSSEYAVAHFVRQLAAIEAGLQAPVLETGDLTPCRDLTDVRDMVSAYQLLMAQGRTGEAYNVGSGVARSMQEIVDRLLAETQAKITLRQKPGLLRAAETQVVRADIAKIRGELGWTSRYTLEQTLADTLNYWRTFQKAAAGTESSGSERTPRRAST